MPFFMGIDVGTSGTRVLLVDVPDGGPASPRAAKVVAAVTHGYPLSVPRPLWAEQDPALWWDAAVAGIREVLATPGIRAEQVAGVGLTGQMHGAVCLDAADKVVRPAILWCDQRTAAQCEVITKRVGAEKVWDKTLNPMLTGFTAPKLVWMQQYEPEVWARVRSVLLPKDYLRFRLTGERATDVADASGTGLLNVRKRKWSSTMFTACGLDYTMLPRVYESPELTGGISESAAELTGLPVGTAVVAGAGDQAAGAVGAGVVREGLASCTIGTSGVLFAHVAEPWQDPELRTHTFCAAVPGEYHVMGVMLSAGGSLRWFRDTLGADTLAAAREQGVDPYDLLIAEATIAPLGCEGLFFLPYLSGERCPYPDPNARGAFIGLTLRHTRAHLARAVLEGVTYGMLDILEIFREIGIEPTEIRLCGGGARSPFWRQMQADVFDTPCVRMNVDEGPAFGAALLAAVGTGAYPSVPAACRATLRVTDHIKAKAANTDGYARYYPIYQRLYGDLEEASQEIAEAESGSV